RRYSAVELSCWHLGHRKHLDVNSRPLNVSLLARLFSETLIHQIRYPELLLEPRSIEQKPRTLSERFLYTRLPLSCRNRCRRNFSRLATDPGSSSEPVIDVTRNSQSISHCRHQKRTFSRVRVRRVGRIARVMSTKVDF